MYLYLATSGMSVSAVLVNEVEGKQHPIYFVSRTLNDAKRQYLEIERTVLALVYAARKLLAYFHAHSIIVISSLPLRNVIHSPERSGRLMKWAVELSEHDINFKGMSATRPKPSQIS